MSNESVRQRTAQLVLLKIDTETDEGRELSGRFGVSAIPAVLFLDRDGDEVHRFRGFIPPEQFHKELDKAASKAGLDSG